MLPDPEAALARAWERMRPGGRLVVMDAGLPDNLLGRALGPLAHLLVKLAPGDPYSNPWRDLRVENVVARSHAVEHLVDLLGELAAVAARRRELPGASGLVFAKALPFIGSGASAGFGAGVPALQRQILLTAWRQEADFERFLGQPPAQRLVAEARHSWWSLFEVASTRGSHYGSKPLSSRERSVADGPFAALTLGRVRSRSLPRFLREGARLGSFVREAPGLVSAVSAGWPPAGNCTISIWKSEQHMLDFAYGDVEGHGDTVRRDPPILTEQLNARLRARRLSGSWGPDAMHPLGLTPLVAALSKEEKVERG